MACYPPNETDRIDPRAVSAAIIPSEVLGSQRVSFPGRPWRNSAGTSDAARGSLVRVTEFEFVREFQTPRHLHPPPSWKPSRNRQTPPSWSSHHSHNRFFLISRRPRRRRHCCCLRARRKAPCLERRRTTLVSNRVLDLALTGPGATGLDHTHSLLTNWAHLLSFN